MKKRPQSSGFTIIETLIYLALYAIMITGIVAAAYLLFASGDRNQSKAELQEEKNFIVAKINFAMSGAKVAAAAGTSLTIQKYDLSTVVISASGGNILYNGDRLNNSDTTVSNVSFVTGSNPDYLEAGFKINGTTSNGQTISQWATTTSYIRK